MNTQDRKIFTRFKEENFVSRPRRNRPNMKASDRYSAKQRVIDTLRLDPDEAEQVRQRTAQRCMP